MGYSEKVQQIIDIAKSMSLMEAKETVDAFKAEFGVEPASGGGLSPEMLQALTQGGGGGGGGAQAAAEPTEFDVVLKSFGPQKINVIKVVRSLTSLGLKEAKDLVEGAPKTVKEGVDKEEADKVKAELEAAGAVVELKPAG